MIVFLVSGLCHGANVTYVVWGGINGLNQVFVTFVLVDFAWVFFRADSIHSALSILKSMITVHNPWILFDESLYNLGLSRANFGVMLFSIFILLAADYLKYKGIQVRAVLEKQELWFRWLFYVLAVDFVIILVYGEMLMMQLPLFIFNFS